MSDYLIERKWAMPNRETFSIPPIKKLILEELPRGVTIDPFARNSKLAEITNDLDPETNAKYHLDAIDFLNRFKSSSVDGVLFDPPYTPRQVLEVYRKLGKTVNLETPQASHWSEIKDKIALIVKPEGKVISFGWNSNGIGKGRGFKLTRVLLVAHGARHNDTICTVEKKVQTKLS